MSSVSKLIEGLSTKEEVLHAVAPDPKPRDLAVWEAASIFSRGWKPRLNAAADNNHDFLYLEEKQVKELMKRLVTNLMDVEGESSIKDVVQVIVAESKSPEEMVFSLIALADMAFSSLKKEE